MGFWKGWKEGWREKGGVDRGGGSSENFGDGNVLKGLERTRDADVAAIVVRVEMARKQSRRVPHLEHDKPLLETLFRAVFDARTVFFF